MTQAFNLGLLANNVSTAGRLDVSLGLSVPLGTASNVQHGSLGIGTTAPSQTGNILATGTITAGISDDALKTRLSNLEGVLPKLKELDCFTYELNELGCSLGLDQTVSLGCSAQQMEKQFPQLVVPAPIDAKYKTIIYNFFRSRTIEFLLFNFILLSIRK